MVPRDGTSVFKWDYGRVLSILSHELAISPLKFPDLTSWVPREGTGIVRIRSAVPSVLVRTSLCWLGLDQPGPMPQVASDLCYA